MLVLLSGAIATGKTAVAERAAATWPAELVRVRLALSRVLGVDARDRITLQREGADLDRRTRGRWLRDYLLEHVEADTLAVVDSLRTPLQTVPILDTISTSRLVFLEAHETTRRARYSLAAETDPVKASVDFDTAMNHPTEQVVHQLRDMADLVIQTDELSVQQITELLTSQFPQLTVD